MPFERYLTEADIAGWALRSDVGKCKVCKGDMTLADLKASAGNEQGRVIRKGNSLS